MSPNVASQSLQHGQEALPSFEILYDRYHVQVYPYLHAHLRHEHDAADLMQQVFFQAWRQAQTYEPRRGSVAAWLFSIAHHRLVDFYRVSRPSISLEAVPDIAAMDQNPEAHVISYETVAQVKMLLEALPQEEQELLALRFAARLSSKEYFHGTIKRSDMNYTSINFQHKFGLFSEQWQPKVIAEMNDYQFKVVKL